nr:fructose-1-phosphate/6-phosphogluconate phosphatase [Plesiomonas shigelloides]
MYDRYQGLIFDMDGTIIESLPAHRQAWEEVLGRYGLPYEPEFMASQSGAPTWQIASSILTRHGADLDPRLIAKQKADAVELLLFDLCRPLPLIEDVVKAYHGRRPMAVGTGSETAVAEALLCHMGLRDYFAALVGANDVQAHKPAPDTFLLCAEKLGIAPQHCVVFEDAEFGLQAARRAGMDVVDVRTLY